MHRSKERSQREQVEEQQYNQFDPFPNVPQEYKHLPLQTQAWLSEQVSIGEAKQSRTDHEVAKRKAIQEILEIDRRKATAMRDKKVEKAFHDSANKSLSSEGR